MGKLGHEKNTRIKKMKKKCAMPDSAGNTLSQLIILLKMKFQLDSS